MDDNTPQNEVFEQINRLCTNFKSDSSSRKTKEYLIQRLTSLEAYWEDFTKRHQLLLEREDKGIQYFTGNIYEKTKHHLYGEIRVGILQRLLATEGKQAEVVIRYSQGSDIRTKELLNRQECQESSRKSNVQDQYRKYNWKMGIRRS